MRNIVKVLEAHTLSAIKVSINKIIALMANTEHTCKGLEPWNYIRELQPKANVHQAVWHGLDIFTFLYNGFMTCFM